MNQLLLAIRIKDWWNSIIPPVLSFYFIGIQHSDVLIDRNSFFKVIDLFVLSIFTASFGFYLNEFTDIKNDLQAGKNNAIAIFSKYKSFLILVILTTLTFISIYPLSHNKYIVGLFSLQILLFVLYSCPPFRLKNSPPIAIFLDSLYSGTLPFFIALLFSNAQITLKLFILTLAFGIAKGARNILYHIEKDLEIDQKAGQKTLAHIIKKPMLFQLQFALFLVEIIAILSITFSTAPLSFYIILIGLFILFLKIYYYSFYSKNILIRHKWLTEINSIYEVWLPVAILTTLIPLGWQITLSGYLCLFLVFPGSRKIINELGLLLRNAYYIIYNIYYSLSDTYFLHAKPYIRKQKKSFLKRLK